MNIIGIPAEYNPFHNGHALQIAKIKTIFPDSLIIAAMSGHAVQRGSFAVMDKWQRGALAVQNGVDLVFELPYSFCAQTAERFAFGAVSLLHAAGCDHLAFGTETERFDSLQQIAEILAEEPQNYHEKLHAALQKGKSFAAARQATIAELTDEKTADLLKTPNNILAVEYLKWIGGRFFCLDKSSQCLPIRPDSPDNKNRPRCPDSRIVPTSATASTDSFLQSGKPSFSSHMTPLPILREGAVHNQSYLTQELASASAIRQALIRGSNLDTAQVLPYSADCLDRAHYCSAIEAYETVILSKLLTVSPENLRNLPDVSEGLEFTLLNAVKYHYQIDELVSAAASSRMPQSRIRRILMNGLLSFTKDDFEALSKQPPAYLRVLAFNHRGQFWLKHLRKESSLPILTNLHSNQTCLSAAGRRSLSFDCRSTDLFYLLRGEKAKIHADYRKHPVVFMEELQ